MTHRSTRAALLCAVVLGLCLAGGSRAQSAAPTSRQTTASQLDALDATARVDPKGVVARLDELLLMLPADEPLRVLALALRGTLQAANHDPEGTEHSLNQLDALQATDRGAAAASALVRATLASFNRSPLRLADRLATEAQALLPADAPPMLRLRLLTLHATIKEDRAELDQALLMRHQALALADNLGPAWRRSDARSRLAYTLLLAGQAERGREINHEALALAQAAGDDMAISRALNKESFFRAEAGDTAGELRATQGAIEHARRAGGSEDEVLGLANLADYYLKHDDFGTALRLAREALPRARALGNLTTEWVALANIGLALISLHRPDEGLRYTRAAMDLDERAGAMASMAQFELEVGGYLERAGYLREAMSAYQRQRAWADEVSLRDQQQAILALEEGNDHQRRQRSLELLQRENDLHQAQLLHQALTQRLWAAGALATVLLLLVASVLLRRLRRHNATLTQDNAALQALGEVDSLTGLANRRHLLRITQPESQPATPFAGSLLLIDIDRFKRINDRHGHAAGDAVLVEVSRRLQATLRDGDLVVRWGGEEFLVLARGLTEVQLETLAQRLLAAIGAAPVRLAGEPVSPAPGGPDEDLHVPGEPARSDPAALLSVTASIGFASFPIEPNRLAAHWASALALVDAALYLAKSQGRNQAWGVRRLQARDEAGLAQISRSLEAAWHDDRAQLVTIAGPVQTEVDP